MIAIITFSRVYEILDAETMNKEQLIKAARDIFDVEYDFLNASENNFSAKVSIKPNVSQPLKEEENGTI